MYAVFVEAMRERGWVEGTHYVVDAASYGGRAERIPAAVAEAVARQPDLIIGSGTPTMRPLMQATKTIPIVMFTVADPLGQGFVTSLARPGGNVTGLSSVDHGLLAKQFELLLQAAPQVRRVGVVYNPDFPPHLPGLRDVETVAQRQGVQVRALALRTPGEIDATFDALQRERVEAVHFFLQPFLNTGAGRARGGAGAAAALADGDGRCVERARRHPGRLFLQERGPAAPAAALRDPHPGRHAARRDAGGAADALLHGAEPEDRQGAGPDAAADPAVAGR